MPSSGPWGGEISYRFQKQGESKVDPNGCKANITQFLWQLPSFSRELQLPKFSIILKKGLSVPEAEV